MRFQSRIPGRRVRTLQKRKRWDTIAHERVIRSQRCVARRGCAYYKKGSTSTLNGSGETNGVRNFDGAYWLFVHGANLFVQ